MSLKPYNPLMSLPLGTAHSGLLLIYLCIYSASTDDCYASSCVQLISLSLMPLGLIQIVTDAKISF